MADTLVNVPFRTMVERCLKAVNPGAGQNSSLGEIFAEEEEKKSADKNSANDSRQKEKQKIRTEINSEVIKRFLKP
jgi:hypothetical protein